MGTKRHMGEAAQYPGASSYLGKKRKKRRVACWLTFGEQQIFSKHHGLTMMMCHMSNRSECSAHRQGWSMPSAIPVLSHIWWSMLLSVGTATSGLCMWPGLPYHVVGGPHRQVGSEGGGEKETDSFQLAECLQDSSTL